MAPLYNCLAIHTRLSLEGIWGSCFGATRISNNLCQRARVSGTNPGPRVIVIETEAEVPDPDFHVGGSSCVVEGGC